MVVRLVALRFVLLSTPATKPEGPKCAVRQPTPEEKRPVEELDRVIH